LSHVVNYAEWQTVIGKILLQGDHLSEKPGNVREFDSCQGNVRNFTKHQGNVMEKILSGKSGLKLFIVSCIFTSIRALLNLSISFWFRIMHCCIPTPTTDNNTSTGVIRVTLNMGRSAANRRGNVMELSGNFSLYGEWSTCY